MSMDIDLLSWFNRLCKFANRELMGSVDPGLAPLNHEVVQ